MQVQPFSLALERRVAGLQFFGKLPVGHHLAPLKQTGSGQGECTSTYGTQPAYGRGAAAQPAAHRYAGFKCCHTRPPCHDQGVDNVRLLVDLFQGQCIDADPGNRGYLASHGRYEQQPIRWIAGKSAAQQPRYRGEDLKWPRGVEQQQLIECQHHHRTRRGARHGSKRGVFGMERHGLPRHTRFHAHRGDRQCSPAAHNTSGT